jgi:hypothetical protein
MTPTEFQYIQRAVQELEKTMSLPSRFKIERTMSQVLARSADQLEKTLVDKIEDRLYNSNTKQRSEHA